MASQRKHYVLFIIWTFVCIVSGEFVQLDREALGKRFLVWTGIRPINEGTTITDEDLSNIARDAYDEMIIEFTALSLPAAGTGQLPKWARAKRPTVMASLIDPAGDRLYFASSIKTSMTKAKLEDHMKDLGIIGTRVARELEKCQQGIVIEKKDNVLHGFKASCGEIMLSVLYFLDRGGDAEIKGSRVVAVEGDGDNVVVKDFCTQNPDVVNSYGCSEFLKGLGIEFTPAPVNGATRQLGLGQMRQMSLCPAPPIRARL
ncbi:hypothetical protein BDV96DRAFT_590594 [Lophiotrema nucula]|uniref:Uncharacterized protein n=1 Tax=Lophiotrema nucula TaxID=690887 RepID=A0A6A5YIQ3_9PLEO|nr:hypothetical protein BDV96DRAFT_590594 [Lophiotrema nucula]